MTTSYYHQSILEMKRPKSVEPTQEQKNRTAQTHLIAAMTRLQQNQDVQGEYIVVDTLLSQCSAGGYFFNEAYHLGESLQERCAQTDSDVAKSLTLLLAETKSDVTDKADLKNEALPDSVRGFLQSIGDIGASAQAAQYNAGFPVTKLKK